VKIFSADQFRKWDEATIRNEPVSSSDLMERAARKCRDWIFEKNFHQSSFKIFCGKGNNGGDGLAIARLLAEDFASVFVYIVEGTNPGSADFNINLKSLSSRKDIPVSYISTPQDFPGIEENCIVIDALFGTGLNKPPAGIFAALIEHMNSSPAVIISIDMPSGMFADKTSHQNSIVHARYTLSFGGYKLGFMAAENAAFFGEVHILDIGLDQNYGRNENAHFELVEESMTRKIFRSRNPFSHKGNFGHALLAAGSYGKMGAAILAAKACLHSGSGLLTMRIPKCGYDIIQKSVPEAMADADESELHLQTNISNAGKYNAAGIGPGIGTDKRTIEFVADFLRSFQKPLVIDADALNCISIEYDLFSLIPPHSILTPHPKEFDRLFGIHQNEFERIDKAIQISKAHDLIIVLKGHRTLIAGPNTPAYFNSTGNAGMAKGGSGDVLTGLITSFLAQNYAPLDAALIGCYIHGLAGDNAAARLTEEYMTPTDIVNFLPSAFRFLKENS
jgi:ADP-dependent NAD(P)H-hydrate dehydratase / NAD(P)H-hydrate epimerase